MNKIVIIADDLTGANATAVLLARKGYKAATFLRLEEYSAEKYQDYEVISINTDSRAIPVSEAYQRVANTTKALASDEVHFFSKRIDSTLRGNLGAEIDGVLDVLGPETMAVVVAAFPKSGRITVGGYLMVDSIPLEKTFAAKDPKTPVNKSSVAQLVGQQTKYQVGQVSIETVLKGAQAVAEAIANQKQQGNRVVVFDAATQDDLEQIAKGVCLSGIKVVAVDPGPFTDAVAQCIAPRPNRHRGRKVLMMVGSVTPLTCQQLTDVENNYAAALVYADAEALIDPAQFQQEVARVTKAVLPKINDYEIVGVRTIKDDAGILDLPMVAEKFGITEDEIAQRIAEGLAAIAKDILQKSAGALGALYTSGGDVTVAVCRELGAVGVEVKDEVLPLAAYGRLISGSYHNTPIVTKGGLVGDRTAITQCIEYLLTKVSTEYYPEK